MGTVLLFAVAVSPARGADYCFAIDVPARLGGVEYRPDEIVRSDGGAYTLELDFADPGLQLAGVHLRPDGRWLLTPAVPTEGAEPRDVVLFDGVSLSPYFDGSVAGVSDDARIDALFLDPGGSLILSFDVPVKLGGTEYSQSDLVRWGGGTIFTLFWDAEAAGVPAGSNVLGADLDSDGNLVVSFDVPTSLGGIEFLPGQLVRWTGAGFALHFSDGAWPLSAQLRDFAFVPAAGAVPDGATSGTPLAVTPAGSDITLSWDAGCSPSTSDYAIYEGTLGVYYSHTQKFCSTGGATTKTFTPPATNAYYIVVPLNAVREGSYGHGSNGLERPPGIAACKLQEVGACP